MKVLKGDSYGAGSVTVHFFVTWKKPSPCLELW